MPEWDDEFFVALEKRIKQDPILGRKLEEMQGYVTFMEDPGRKKLLAKIKTMKGKSMVHLAERMFQGKPASPEEVAEFRGFIKGAIFALSFPDVLDRDVQRSAQLAVEGIGLTPADSDRHTYTERTVGNE